ncbi:MAG TPA: gamma-glutamylcyclotransferase family protein [Pseudolabrys sp.]|nr:gamma-glutamylcyclotransferase family protein [Pseudolabrys sp.]
MSQEVSTVTLYFAYGLNMDGVAMKRRCPGAKPLRPAVLDGYRFCIGAKGGWGSLLRSPGDTVHGVLWRLSPRDVAALHAYEMVGKGLYSVQYLPVRCAGRPWRAMIYMLRNIRLGKARRGYLQAVIAAARSWNFPEDYIHSLQRLTPAGVPPGRGN